MEEKSRFTGPDSTREREEYRTIDGNWTVNAEAYCVYHKGYLTKKQIKVHGCLRRHRGVCPQLRDMEGGNTRMNAEQRFQSTLDKMQDKLMKIDVNLTRILKELQKLNTTMENISNDINMTPLDRALRGMTPPQEPEEAGEWKNIHR